MAISINNGVANIVGTPGAISGVFSNRPAAADVAEGTLYFSTDTAAIYQVVSGSWIIYTGGGGGTPGIDDVLAVGQFFSNDRVINVDNFEFLIENIKLFNLKDTSVNTEFKFSQNQIQFFSNSLGFQTDNGVEVTIGDLSIVNGFVLKFDNTNQRLSIIRQTAYNGLDIDFGAGYYQFGDYDNLSGNVSIKISSIPLDRSITITDNLTLNGLLLNFSLNLYSFGNYWNGIDFLTIDGATGFTLLKATNDITLYQGNAGLILTNGNSLLCDPDGNGNSSFFGLDDNAEKLVGSTNLLATIGTPTTDRIKIELNGILYYIVLETA